MVLFPIVFVLCSAFLFSKGGRPSATIISSLFMNKGGHRPLWSIGAPMVQWLRPLSFTEKTRVQVPLGVYQDHRRRILSKVKWICQLLSLSVAVSFDIFYQKWNGFVRLGDERKLIMERLIRRWVDARVVNGDGL